jgi:hypothetical protein
MKPALAALEAREAGGQGSALQELPELGLHEAGQAVPVAQLCRLGSERLEVVAHELVQDLSGRVAGPVGKE